MTMDISKDHVEHIATALETHAVTYHTLARDLRLHVSKSKSILAQYYSANKPRVSASFIATGTRQGTTVVRLFESESDLSAHCKAEFDSVHTVHVYCLSAAANSFTPSEIALEETRHGSDLDNLPSEYALGLIEGPPLEKVSSAPGMPTTKAAPAPKPEARTPSKEQKKEVVQNKPKLEYQSRKQPQKTSLLSNYVSRKPEKTEKVPPAKRAALSESRPYQYKSRKLEKMQPKERVIVSGVESENKGGEEAEVENGDRRNIKERNATVSHDELNNMFLDDFTDDDNANDDNEVADQPIVVENSDAAEDADTMSISREHDAAEDTATMSISREHDGKVQAQSLPENSIWDSVTSKSPAPEISKEAESSPQPETTVDEDGYFVSYKQNEARPPSKQEATRKQNKEPVPKPIKKSDGKKKQASLMNFFGKR